MRARSSVDNDVSMSEWFAYFGFAEIADGLLCGAYPLDAEDVKRLAAERVEVAYNLCEDAEYNEGERLTVQAALAQAEIEERRFPMPDHGRLVRASLDRAIDGLINDLEAGRRVYLHCRAGWQRSAAVAAAVIAQRERVDLARALTIVRERKPPAEPLPYQRVDLIEWWLDRYAQRSATGCADSFDRP
jgi:protein-tyrosine phosphatase